MNSSSVAASSAAQAVAALANKPLPQVDPPQDHDSEDTTNTPVTQVKAAVKDGVGNLVDKTA
jgi:hypothetical protein